MEPLPQRSLKNEEHRTSMSVDGAVIAADATLISSALNNIVSTLDSLSSPTTDQWN